MDSILEGVLKSENELKVKQTMVQKICASGQRSQTVDAIEAMLGTTSRIVVESKNPYSIDACKNIFKVWANCNRSTLKQFVDEQYVDYLLRASFPNSIHTIWLLQECFTMLQTEFGHTPAFQKLCVVVKNEAINFIRENPQYQTVAAFCEFLHSFTQCIPQSQYTLPFCSSLIYSVAGFQSPNDDNRAFRNYVHAVNITIGTFLDHLWKHSDQTCITHCLTAIFNLMSFVNTETDRQISPSFALAGIVQYLPTKLMETIVSRTTENTNISDANLQSAVITMVDFLSWPGTQNIDLWTIAFLKGLAKAHKYSILMEVVELTIEKVFSQLEFPQLRRSCFAVLEHMLLSFQHSPEPFHKVVGKVPELVRFIRQEKREDNFLTSLSELMYTLMHQYPGFPDLYEPVVEVLQDRKRPTQEVMQRRLSQSEWGWQQQKDGTASYIASTSPSRYGRRSETGKAGLINLGNTCYMNSVLQALYMCDSFRQELLSASPSPQQPLLLRLQQVFALLTATQRAALQPIELLQASRPPWFRAGCQQDCSEYLKYVLDQLHEQEMCRIRRETEMKEARAGGSGGGAGELPPQETPAKHRRFKFLSGKKSGGENPGTAEILKNLDLGESLIQKTFGGKVVNVYKCLKCKSESSRVESFMDLTLAFPEAAKAEHSPKWSLPGGAAIHTRSGANQKGPIMDDKPPQQPIALNDLLDYYLSPEKLEGENKYHCDKCKSKQDGERTIQIVETPDYLILTLLRFSYNVKTHSRSKIFTDVQYPKFLQLPISSEPSSPSEPSKKGQGTKSRRNVLKDAKVENYALSAVVVHSGYTSDGGHYYCYARHSIPVTPEDPGASPPWTNGKGEGGVGGGASVQNGPDLLQDRWYMFNDNRVTYSSYESFSNVTQKFAKDTVYVLMYKKILPQDMKGLTVDPNQSVNPQAVDPPLRRDLREAVDRDNKKFLQEQELQERSRAFQRQRSSQFSPGRNFYWKDDDNNGPPGSCGGGGMGGFSARLVY